MATPTRRRRASAAAKPPGTRKNVPPQLGQQIATTGDGRDITRPWIEELQQPRDLRLLQSVDWGVYDRILEDPEVMSTFQQRRRAVVSAEWDVLPGNDKDPRSVEAATAMKSNLEKIGLDRVTEKMLFAIFYGYSVAEIMWAPTEGLIGFGSIKVRHARRFRFDRDNKLRLLTTRNMRGEMLPDRKFWTVSTGASNDDEPYGQGLAYWLYWPTLFKRNGLGFWNTFLDKFGTPTAKGTYRRGTPKEDIAKLLEALQAIATDAGIAVPEGMQVELLEAAKSGTADFEKMVRLMDEMIAKVVLSQTMTTSDGSSHSQAEVHAGVKLEVVTSDADLICESFNDGPSRWWTDLNFGADVACPQLVRLLDEEEDTKTQAETDEVHGRNGWARTEESFKDTYGDGYERKAAPEPPEPGKKGLTPDQPVANDKKGGPAEEVKVVPLRQRSFAEPLPGDTIDRVVDDLIAGDGWTELSPIMGPIADAIAKSDTPEELDEALIASLSQSDVDRLTETLARAGFAVRVSAEMGGDE